MLEIDGRTWITVRKSNLRYYDDVELYYRNPAGRVVLYKPAGMSFTDKALDKKPFLGELYLKPEDKIGALRKAQRGFRSALTREITAGSVETMREIKDDLTAIVVETLSEPRSGGRRLMPGLVSTVVVGYSTALPSINVMALTLGYCFYTGRSQPDFAQFAYSLTDSGSRRSKQTSPEVDRPEIGRIVGEE